MRWRRAAVALGSNEGDRFSYLGQALAGLRGLGEVEAVSSVWEGPARELEPGAREEDRAPYLNAVVRLRTWLKPEGLLAGLLAVEMACGRVRLPAQRHAARTLDLDLVLVEGEARDHPFVRVPHPLLARRAFVGVPLREVWPKATWPDGSSLWERGMHVHDPQLSLVRAPGWEEAYLTGGRLMAPREDLLRYAETAGPEHTAPVYVYGEVSSTSDVARVLALAGAPHGTACVAERQSRGRGRQGRTWWSPREGEALLLTVILREGASMGGLLPLAAGTAVAEACEAVGSAPIFLKWPNDLWVRQGGGWRKAGGILAERLADQSTLVGVGLNLRPPGEKAPPQVRETAGGLTVDKSLSREELLERVVARLTFLAREVEAAGPRDVVRRWQARSLLLGQEVTVYERQGSFRGIAQGIEEDGSLRVRLPGGEIRRVQAADVSLTHATQP